MRHNYKKIIAYDPTNNVVNACKLMSASNVFCSTRYDEAFWEIYAQIDRTQNIIIGVSLTDQFYQLSPVQYRSSYIKEDATSMEPLNRSTLLRAISVYQNKHNLWPEPSDF